MKLTADQVKKVAKLANLPLTIEEEEKYSEQLSAILEYVDQLNQVDTSGVEPTFNVTGLNNVIREDETAAGLSREEALSDASKTKDSMFETKGVFDE
ncbi:MAG: Asp-tRNA(Asn)/Glu-tRNA(Gln) amidotransferase subunit GatC [Candidatus Daviesbacteria bacterium]|nr:Asp-tRNA(Asn)/Glu-tRNA(Gln) amidotransferase subunit GatC [Candidatus Daviesbacteria bacterium]